MLNQDNCNLNEDPNSLKNSALTRIQHDLNSPSVNIRIRAMNALKSPSIIYYNNFDISNDEEDIEFNEGKRLHLVKQPLNIKEVMKDVTVYVEVRNGEDNHSAGIKEVISELGAKVNDRLLRNTTHVIFKDGIQSTYNKAKKWQIPIVSILWIEACKENIKLMDCDLYPISNKDRYENPDLYGKIKKVKYMQPGAEDSNRRNKSASKKINITPKNIKPSVRMPPKTRDSLNDMFFDFQEKLTAIAADEDGDDDYMPFKSKLLEYIRNSPVTQRTLTTSQSFKDSKVVDNSYQNQINAVKSLDFSGNNKLTPTIKNTTIPKFNNISKLSTPKRKASRNTCIGISNSTAVSNKTTNSITKNNKISSNAIGQKRISNFFPKQKDLLNSCRDEKLNISEKKENMSPFTPNGKILSNTKLMELKKLQISSDYKETQNLINKYNSSPINPKSNNKNVIEQLHTIDENDVSKTIIFNANKKPSNRRKTIFECSMDIIDKNLQNINQLSKLNKSLADDNKIDKSSNSLYKNDNSSVNGIKSSNSLVDAVVTPKKRKLFIPEQMLVSTPTGKEITDSLKLISLGSAKRRRDNNNYLQLKLKEKRQTINIMQFDKTK